MRLISFLKTSFRPGRLKKSGQGVRWGISCGISGLSLAIMITMGFHAHHLHQQNENLEQKLTSLSHRLRRSQEAADLLKTYPEDFAAFEISRFEHSVTPQTLQQSFPQSLEFGPISYPEEGGKNADIVCQKISLSIPCLQDTDLFILLDTLTHQGPGIFQIHEVTIHRVSPLNEEMLSKISMGKPQALFDGKISATWIHR